MLISAASSLGEYAEKRRKRFAVQVPSEVVPCLVLAVNSQLHPGCYDVVVVVSPPLQVEDGTWVLLAQGDEIDFRNVVLPDDPLDCIIIGAATGDVTKRELWEACKSGEPTQLMKESLFS